MIEFGAEGSDTLISGKRRAGKTFLVALLSLIYADAGIQVYSNFGLFLPRRVGEPYVPHPNCKLITFYDLVSLLEVERFEPYAILSLHEARAWASSHRAFSDTTEFFDDLNFQGGKSGLNIVADTQLTMRVDNSMRELANFRFLAERDDVNQQFVYWELDKRFPNEDVKVEDEENFTVSFNLASQYWNRYKTWDKLFPLGINDLKIKMMRQEPKLMCNEIDRQVNLLVKEGLNFGLGRPSDCSVVRVENALLRLNEHIVFSKYVADRLKLEL